MLTPALAFFPKNQSILTPALAFFTKNHDFSGSKYTGFKPLGRLALANFRNFGFWHWVILIKNESIWYISNFQNNFQNEKSQIISCQATESSHLRMSHCLFRTYPGIIKTVTQHERVNFNQPVRLLPWAVSNSASGN